MSSTGRCAVRQLIGRASLVSFTRYFTYVVYVATIVLLAVKASEHKWGEMMLSAAILMYLTYFIISDERTGGPV